MKLLLHPFFVQLLILFYDAESVQLQRMSNSKQDLENEERGPKPLSGSFALSSVLYKWATLYGSPSEIGLVIQELNITDNCKAHTIEFLFRLASQKHLMQSPWAMQMIDSWGKFPEGILKGHLNAVGDYDECVSVDVTELQFLGPVGNLQKYSTKFRGLYCTLRLLIPAVEQEQNAAAIMSESKESNSGKFVQNLMDYLPIEHAVHIYPTAGMCFPSSCSTADVNTIVGHVTPKIGPSTKAMVLSECITARSSSNSDAGFWVMIGVMILLLAITVTGTTLDLMQKREVDIRTPILMRAFQAFSAIRNIKKLFKTEAKGEFNFECINGIRTLTLLWIILLHTWLMLLKVVPYWNAVEGKQMMETLYLSPIMNGFIGVDTFLTVTGLLTCSNLLKAHERSKGRVSLLWLYLHRYVRLTPAYAVLVGVYATILPYLASGPFRLGAEAEGEACRANWWTNLLYLNNFIHTDKMCAGHGWYLAVDMQLFIIAPLVVFSLWRHPRVGVALLSVMTVVAILTPGLQSHFHHLLPTAILNRDNGLTWTDAYIKPWTYLQPYLAGIWLGWFLFKNSGIGANLSQCQVATGWLLSTLVALGVLYGINPWFNPKNDIPQLTGFLYASLHRFAWGISMCWIIYACSCGHGVYVNRFLSWKPFIPLGRLSYSAYLVSILVMEAFDFSRQQPFYYSFYSTTYLVFGHTVMSLSVGFVWTILFESPFVQLEKLARAPKGHPKEGE